MFEIVPINLLLCYIHVTKVPGGTCHVCIRVCLCHVFGSEISLESHFLGSKI